MGWVSSLEDIIETFFANNFEHGTSTVPKGDEKRLRELADRLLSQIKGALDRQESERLQAIESMRAEATVARRELIVEQHKRAQEAARAEEAIAELRGQLSEFRQTSQVAISQLETQIIDERKVRENVKKVLRRERQNAEEIEKQRKEARKEAARLSLESAPLRSALSQSQRECVLMSSEKAKLEAQVMTALVDKRLKH